MRTTARRLCARCAAAAAAGVAPAPLVPPVSVGAAPRREARPRCGLRLLLRPPLSALHPTLSPLEVEVLTAREGPGAAAATRAAGATTRGECRNHGSRWAAARGAAAARRGAAAWWAGGGAAGGGAEEAAQ